MLHAMLHAAHLPSLTTLPVRGDGALPTALPAGDAALPAGDAALPAGERASLGLALLERRAALFSLALLERQDASVMPCALGWPAYNAREAI